MSHVYIDGTHKAVETRRLTQMAVQRHIEKRVANGIEGNGVAIVHIAVDNPNGAIDILSHVWQIDRVDVDVAAVNKADPLAASVGNKIEIGLGVRQDGARRNDKTAFGTADESGIATVERTIGRDDDFIFGRNHRRIGGAHPKVFESKRSPQTDRIVRLA